MRRAAVIDLGTNTFHLLISEATTNEIIDLKRATEPVKLGEGGINDGLIQSEPFARGLKCMKQFAADIAEFNVSVIRAIATSAIRNASNGQGFVAQVFQHTGIKIEIIDGLTEAQFIYSGIRSSGCLTAENSLIIDIGGGSIEFIIGNTDEIKWKKSFEIGAARMMELFHQKDPLHPKQLLELMNWLNGHLKPLWEAVEKYPVQHLIGASGSFETFAEMAEVEKQIEFDIASIKTYKFDMADFHQMVNTLQSSSHAERAGMKSILPVRVDMVVTSALLARFVIEKLAIKKLTMSTYSLKEGVMAEILGSLA